uniref:Importin-13 n=1 Tax=Gadus morhua TaxID=8049 RepID=A0A8C5BZ04_GADMO
MLPLVCVSQALQQLYYDPDMEQKNAAQRWLTQAQASPQAWHFCWALLGPDKLPEVQFFGASTLHTKISHHWADLQPDQHPGLRTQLLSHVLRFSSGPRMVLTRLCVALASLALNLVPQAWPKPVADLVRGPQEGPQEPPPHARCLVLLELLTVLPEEFQSSRLAQARRAQLREALAGEWATVCPLLRRLLQSPDSPGPVKQRVLRCLSGWTALGVALEESRGLVEDCFSALGDAELFDAAVETIVTVLSQPDCQRCRAALGGLIPVVLGLRERLEAAAGAGDMETTHGICRIAVALGETHSRVLLEQVDLWQDYLALVNMILFCTGTPGHYPVSETSSSLTLTFWYTLQDDIMSLEEERQALYLSVYREVYVRLVEVLLQKAHYAPEEEYASWSVDDKEQFRTYRVDISDTLMYVYEMLGAELLSSLYERLGGLVLGPGRGAAWQDIEALLFGFQSIAETIDVNYSDVIPGLIGLLPRISISTVLLADTVMYTIGSLAEWLADHPVMLVKILPMVLQGLAKPELSVSSVSTLKRICRECQHDLAPYAHDIIRVSQDVLLGDVHKSSQCMWLMQGVGFLLSSLPVEAVLGSLQSFLSPHIQRLESLAQQQPCPSSKPSIIHILGLLSSLFTTLDINRHAPSLETAVPAPPTPPQAPHNPVVVVLQQVLTLIQNILSKWLNDSEVVEAVCGVFEKSVRTLLHGFGPMVPQLSAMLGQIYCTYPQSSALDLTRQMVHIFAAEREFFSPVQDLVKVLTSATLAIFQQGNKRWGQILSVIISCSDVFYVLQTELFPRFKDLPAVGAVVLSEGRLLVQTLLQAVGGEAPRSLGDHFSEVLFSMNRNCVGLLARWLEETLQDPTFPSTLVSIQQKDAFRQREQTNRRQVKDVVKEFSLLCRGQQGVGYSTQ